MGEVNTVLTVTIYVLILLKSCYMNINSTSCRKLEKLILCSNTIGASWSRNTRSGLPSAAHLARYLIFWSTIGMELRKWGCITFVNICNILKYQPMLSCWIHPKKFIIFDSISFENLKRRRSSQQAVVQQLNIIGSSSIIRRYWKIYFLQSWVVPGTKRWR